MNAPNQGNTLTEFLLARIEEEEGVARHPTPRDADLDDVTFWDEVADAQLHTAECGYRMGEFSDPCRCNAPARVLAECEAKRRIVEHHEYGMGYRSLPWSWGAEEEAYEVCGACYERDADGYASNAKAPCLTLRLLALPYADHPDYQEAWRP